MEQKNSLISVYGVGNLKVQPNVIYVSITISDTSNTISVAQAEVNKKVNLLLNIFKELEIEKFQTSTIKFQPEYRWENNSQILIGQKVEQGVVVTITDINKNLQKAKELLDKITNDIDSLTCSMNFGLDNYQEKVVEARTLAYNNAFEKAKQYAKLAGLEIIKAIKISEFETVGSDYSYECCDSAPIGSSGSVSTEISVGDTEIEAKLYCDFTAK